MASVATHFVSVRVSCNCTSLHKCAASDARVPVQRPIINFEYLLTLLVSFLIRVSDRKSHFVPIVHRMTTNLAIHIMAITDTCYHVV